jgi:hypothetical protein
MPGNQQARRERSRMWLAWSAAALLFLVSAREAGAHHSFAMYDTTKLVVITGTVKEFQWTNPHALLWVTGSTPDGGPADLWTIELPTSPGNLTRMGWTKHSLGTGDALTVEINPLRDGSHGGSFKKATLAKTGAVLIANPTNDPYAGDASVDSDGGGGYPPEGGSGDGSAGPPKARCSLSSGASLPDSSLGALLAMSVAATISRRRRSGRYESVSSASGAKGTKSQNRPRRIFSAQAGSTSSARPTATRSTSPR